MPTYQYSCTDCGHFFEQVQSFSDDSLTECPECGGKLRKVFNAVGVVFKGSGFYRNDSRGTEGGGKGEKVGAEKSGAEKSGSEKSGSDKADSSKPAEKKSDSPAAKKSDSSSGSSSSSASPKAS